MLIIYWNVHIDWMQRKQKSKWTDFINIGAETNWCKVEIVSGAV